MFSANSLLFHLLQNWRLLAFVMASVCELMGPTDFNFHITHVSLSPSQGHGHHFLSQHISINWSVMSTLFSYQICVLRLIEGHIEQIHQSWPQSALIKVLCLTIYNSYISWTMRKKMRKVHIAAGEVINLCGCGSHRPRSNLCAGLSKQ